MKTKKMVVESKIIFKNMKIRLTLTIQNKIIQSYRNILINLIIFPGNPSTINVKLVTRDRQNNNRT